MFIYMIWESWFNNQQSTGDHKIQNEFWVFGSELREMKANGLTSHLVIKNFH